MRRQFESLFPVCYDFGDLIAIGGSLFQANLMVYQAVAEYFTRVKEEDMNGQNLNVDVLLPGRPNPDKFSFNRQNFHLTRSSKVRTNRLYEIFSLFRIKKMHMPR